MTRPQRLTVNPIACHAHGLCAEMLPDLVRLDEWGYPLLTADPIGPRRRREVRAAVRACPTLALRLDLIPRNRDVTTILTRRSGLPDAVTDLADGPG